MRGASKCPQAWRIEEGWNFSQVINDNRHKKETTYHRREEGAFEDTRWSNKRGNLKEREMKNMKTKEKARAKTQAKHS